MGLVVLAATPIAPSPEAKSSEVDDVCSSVEP